MCLSRGIEGKAVVCVMHAGADLDQVFGDRTSALCQKV